MLGGVEVLVVRVEHSRERKGGKEGRRQAVGTGEKEREAVVKRMNEGGREKERAAGRQWES